MEEDEASEPLVRLDIVGVAPVIGDEVHQGEGVVGVEAGLVVALEGQPGDATV